MDALMESTDNSWWNEARCQTADGSLNTASSTRGQGCDYLASSVVQQGSAVATAITTMKGFNRGASSAFGQIALVIRGVPCRTLE